MSDTTTPIYESLIRNRISVAHASVVKELEERLYSEREKSQKLEAEVERLWETNAKLENSLRRIIDAPVFDPAKLIDFSLKLLWDSIAEAKATINTTKPTTTTQHHDNTHNLRP